MKKRYRLSVPIPLIPFHESWYYTYAKMLKKVNADRVFLFAPPLHACYTPGLEQFKEWSRILSEKIDFFKSLEIDTAFWMAHTIGHGGKLSVGSKPAFQQLVGAEGEAASGCYCPMDINFRDYICNALSIMAESGIELIMLDDDFRINLHSPEISAGCFCPLHLAAFEERTGLKLSSKEIVSQALCGKPNEMRQKWLELNGRLLLDFANEVETAIHKVNSNARIGLATAMTMWSNEGIDMRHLLESFAGVTRPFLRTIGAPYWSKEPADIAWVIEYTRLQQNWAKGWNIELMAEGDSFPHTGYYCPAATLHAYHQGLFAAGFTNILSYALPYASKPQYEERYINKIFGSLPNYDAICDFFPEDYLSVGINPIFSPNNMMNTILPEKPQKNMLVWPDRQVAVEFLSRLGIPIGYENQGPVFLSGYGAAGISEQELQALLSRGSVVDATAAGWLLERGIDIGLKSVADEKPPVFEKYSDPKFSGTFFGETVWLLTAGDKTCKRCEPVQSASVISRFTEIDGSETFPAVILYENARGQRFCILAFDFYNAVNGKQLLYSYARQEQLTRCIAWVNTEPLTVTVNSHPDIHVICRKSPDGNRIAVALQNCHLDSIINPVLRLNPKIKVDKKIELLPPDADKAHTTADFHYKNDGDYGYLEIECTLPPMGMLGVGLK